MAYASLPADLPADFGAAFGRITQLERMSIDDMKLMVLLETAGDPLYQKLAELAPNDEASKLFLANAREETAHAHRLKRAIEILTGAPFEIPPLSENPYAEPPAFPPLTVELLQGLVGAEDSGDLLYQKLADAEANPEVAELLRQNGREETRHGQRVARVIEILQACA